MTQNILIGLLCLDIVVFIVVCWVIILAAIEIAIKNHYWNHHLSESERREIIHKRVMER